MNLCSDGVIDEEEYERRSDLLNAMDTEEIRVEYNLREITPSFDKLAELADSTTPPPELFGKE